MRTINVKRCVCASALLLLIGSAASAGPCTNASLIGAYGYQEQGQIAANFSSFRAVGEFVFAGNGNGTRQPTIWYSTFEVAAEGKSGITYTVNPDCTFSLTYVSNGETFTGVIVDGGQKLFYIETSGDPSRSGQAERLKSNQ